MEFLFEVLFAIAIITKRGIYRISEKYKWVDRTYSQKGYEIRRKVSQDWDRIKWKDQISSDIRTVQSGYRGIKSAQNDGEQLKIRDKLSKGTIQAIWKEDKIDRTNARQVQIDRDMHCWLKYQIRD